MATAFFCPTNTTSRFPLVTPVHDIDHGSLVDYEQVTIEWIVFSAPMPSTSRSRSEQRSDRAGVMTARYCASPHIDPPGPRSSLMLVDDGQNNV